MICDVMNWISGWKRPLLLEREVWTGRHEIAAGCTLVRIWTGRETLSKEAGSRFIAEYETTGGTVRIDALKRSTFKNVNPGRGDGR